MRIYPNCKKHCPLSHLSTLLIWSVPLLPPAMMTSQPRPMATWSRRWVSGRGREYQELSLELTSLSGGLVLLKSHPHVLDQIEFSCWPGRDGFRTDRIILLTWGESRLLVVKLGEINIIASVRSLGTILKMSTTKEKMGTSDDDSKLVDNLSPFSVPGRTRDCTDLSFSGFEVV